MKGRIFFQSITSAMDITGVPEPILIKNPKYCVMKIFLTRCAIGRMLLHIGCICRGGSWRFHWTNVSRQRLCAASCSERIRIWSGFFGWMLVLIGCLAGGFNSSAAIYTWDGTTNNWNTAHWLPGPGAGPTSPGTTAIITNGTVTFSGSDTFGNSGTLASPAISLNGGILQSANNFNTIWNLQMGGGTLLANGGYSGYSAAFQLAGTLTVTNTGGSTDPSYINVASSPLNAYNQLMIGGNGNSTLTMNVADVTGSASADLTINTIVRNCYNGAGSLLKNGAGTLLLTAANVYTGGTTNNAGTIAISNNAAFGTAAVTFGGNSAVSAVANLTVANSFAIASGVTGTFDVGGGLNLTNSGVISVISGNGNLQKTNSGTLTLNNANTYNGVTTVSGGTLQIGAGGTSGSINNTTGITLTNGATLTFNRSDTYGGVAGMSISGAGNAVIAAGNLTLSQNVFRNDFTTNSSLTVNSGATLNLINTDRTGKQATTNSGPALTVNGTLISGTTSTTPGYAVFFNPTLNNGATVSTGIGVGGANYASVQFGGTLTANGISTITPLGGTTTTNYFGIGGASGGLTINTPTATDRLTISSVMVNGLNSANKLTKSGLGTLTLSGTNTYNGGTIISAGTIAISNNAAFGTAAVTFGGDSAVSVVANLTVANSFAIASGVTETFDVGAGLSLVNSGAISGAGNLLKTNSGILALSRINTYSGTTAVSAGELIGVTGGSCASSAMTVAAGATNGVQVLISGDKWACTNLTYNAGTTYLDFDFTTVSPSTTTAPLQINGNLALNGALGILIRNGLWTAPGTYPLVSYTGSLTGTVPTAPVVLPSGVTGTLVNNTGAKRIDLNVTAVAGLTHYWTRNSNGNLSGLWSVSTNWAGGIADGVDVTADLSVFNVTANSVITNDAPRTIGTLLLGSTAVNGATVTVDGGINNHLTLATSSGQPVMDVADVQALVGGLSGTQGFTKSGNGALAIYGNNYSNSVSGPINVTGGLLGTVNGAAFKNITGDITVTNGAGFEANANLDGTTFANNLFLSGTGGIPSGVVSNAATPDGIYPGEPTPFGALDLLGNSTLSGIITLYTDSKISHGFNGATLNGPIVASGAGKNLELAITLAGQSALGVNGAINLGTGALTVNGVTGGASVTLAGTNGWGVATVLSNGIAVFGSTNAIGGGGANLTLNAGGTATLSGTNLSPLLARVTAGSAGAMVWNATTSSSTLDFSGNASLSLGSLGSSTYSGVLTPSGGNYRLGGGGGTLTVGSALTGANGLIVNGNGNSGTVVLSGAQTYSGPTTVSGGTLIASGSIAGPLVVASGGTLAPGPVTGIGTLTVNNAVTLAGTTVFSINRTNAQNADLLGASSLILNGTIIVTNIGPALQVGDTFQLLNVSGVISNLGYSPRLPALGAGQHWDFSQLSGNGTITVANGTQLLFNVRDYGAVGDGVHDDCAAINAAVTAAKAAGANAAAAVYFPAGIYYMVSGADSGTQIKVNGASSLTLMGDSKDNTLLRSGDKTKQSLLLQYCTNVTILNLSMDVTPLAFTQGTITSVNTSTKVCTVMLDTGYDDLNRTDFATNIIGNPLFQFRVFRDTNAYSMTWDQNWVPTITAFSQIGSTREWSFTLNQTPSSTDLAKKVLLWPYATTGVPGINLAHCTNTLVQSVNWYGAGWYCGFQYYDCSGFTTFSNFCIGPPPWQTNRLLVDQGGSIGNTYGSLNLINCDFSRCDDDSFNQNSLFIHVLAKLGTAQLQAQDYGGAIWRVGDTVSLWDWTYQQQRERDRATVTSVTYSNGWVLTLDHDVTILKTGAYPGNHSLSQADGVDRLINLNSVGTATIRNCRFNDLRARALVCKAQNALIEGCTIYDQPMPGIMTAEAYWDEGPQTRGLTIRSNLFIRTHAPSVDLGFFYSQKSRDFTNILVEGNIFTNSGPHRPANNSFPQGIGVRIRNANGAIIRNNIFDGVRNANLVVQDSWNVQVYNNLFRNTHPSALDAGTNFGIDSACVVWIDNCTNVSLSGNLVTNLGVLATKLVSVTATCTNISGTNNGVLLIQQKVSLFSLYSGLLLDGAYSPAVQSAAASALNPIIDVRPVANGYAVLGCGGLVLDGGGALSPGAPLQVNAYTGGDSQLWSLAAAGTTNIMLVNKFSGLAADVASTAAGTTVIQSVANANASSQQWNMRASVNVNPPITITSVGGAAGSFYLSLPNLNGSYVVQASTNLANSNAWMNIYTNLAPFTFTDSNAMNLFLQRFYRIKTP